MTKLKCSVGNCSHNKEECCCKEQINVRGSHADCKGGTCCGSFQEKTSNNMVNSMSSAREDTNISCEAKNCQSNQNCTCMAPLVGIAGGNACKCEQTECTSFHCK